MKQYVEIIGLDRCLEDDYDIGDICELKEDRGADSPGHRYDVWTTDKSDHWFFSSSQVELIKREAPDTQEMIEVMEHYARGGEIECAYHDEHFMNWYYWDIAGEPEWNWEMVHYRKAER